MEEGIVVAGRIKPEQEEVAGRITEMASEGGDTVVAEDAVGLQSPNLGVQNTALKVLRLASLSLDTAKKVLDMAIAKIEEQ